MTPRPMTAPHNVQMQPAANDNTSRGILCIAYLRHADGTHTRVLRRWVSIPLYHWHARRCFTFAGYCDDDGLQERGLAYDEVTFIRMKEENDAR